MSGRTRVVVIDDHEVVCLGVERALTDAGVAETVQWHPDLAAVPAAEWLDGRTVVVLDLRLADGSGPRENLAALALRKAPVVVYTSADDPYLVREAIAGGALSIVRKSEPLPVLVEAVRAAAEGRTQPGLDWAAALDADEDFVTRCLSEMEARVLARYASGEASDVVARELCLSRHTVNTYVARIRDKYRAAGRPADSRVDLFRRAAEDGLVSYFNTP